MTLLALLANAAGASAQEGSAVIQLSISNPGARSMGLGGAFVALADDATTAFSNPAGLVQLIRPEISGEVRLGYTEDTEDETDFLGDFNGYSYVSAVYPRGRWSLAAYRHNLAKIDLQPQVGTKDAGPDDRWPFSALDIASNGLAAGYRLTERLSVGLGLSYFVGDLATGAWGSGAERSQDWGLSAGILWRLSPRWGVGASYRQGPEFTARASWIEGAGRSGSLRNQQKGDRDLRLTLPDVYRFGGWFRSAGGAFTVAGEWERLSFSRLVTSFAGNDPLAPTVATSDQLHLGTEYVFLKATPIIALRSGVWLEPADLPVRGLDSDQLHWAAGLGWAWTRSQLDLGLDVASGTATLSVSALVSF